MENPKRLLVSALLIVPLAWHRYLIAGDLGSHVYNAWLAQMIRAGQAPGLHFVGRTSNVLFDYLLDGCVSALGFNVGPRVAMAVVVLTFFWCSFRFINAISRGRAWGVAPVLAAFAYGWTLEAGLINFYLGLGLGFLAAACVIESRQYWLSAVCLLASWLAHPLSTAIAVLIIGFVLLRRLTRWALPLFAGGLVLGSFVLRGYTADPMDNPKPWNLTGVDQLWLFNNGYRLLGWVALASIAVFLLQTVVRRYIRPDNASARTASPNNRMKLALELYAFAWLIAVWAPDAIRPSSYHTPLSEITPRVTLLAAVLLSALAAVVITERWQRGLLLAVTAMYFGLLWYDTGQLSRQAEQIASHVAKVVATAPLGYRGRISTEQITAGVCAGRCFVLNNYEAGTGQFRIQGQLDLSKLNVARATELTAP